LKYYPKGAHLVMVEPNEYYEPLLKKNLNKHSSLHLERLVQCSAENMKMVPDKSVDVVVSTIVLCSIDNIPAVLTEIKRVLVPVRRIFKDARNYFFIKMTFLDFYFLDETLFASQIEQVKMLKRTLIFYRTENIFS